MAKLGPIRTTWFYMRNVQLEKVSLSYGGIDFNHPDRRKCSFVGTIFSIAHFAYS